jgi:shikimate dehydrogenase
MVLEPPDRRPVRGTTAVLAVLGDPVRHSLSPVMHNAALAAMGRDWVYLALPTPPADLAAVVRALEVVGCKGLNITIPHKQAVVGLCRELSPLAARLGAVNTLVPLAGGGWHGTNTDVEGFAAPLLRGGRRWQGCRAVVLGCGGSARAVVAALAELGFASIALAGRRPEALEAVVADCLPWAPMLQPLPWGPGEDSLAAALAGADLVVNTTPVGMASAGDPAAAGACPLSQKDLQVLSAGTWVYDLIYTPRPTELLRQAALRGCTCRDGLEMLVEQGAASLRLWTGVEDVPVLRMQQAALAQLQAAA